MFCCSAFKRNEPLFNHSFLYCAQCFKKNQSLLISLTPCVSVVGGMCVCVCVSGEQEGGSVCCEDLEK